MGATMIVFLLLALIGFVASVVVHAESWGPHPLSLGQTWPLHVGIFIVFIPMILGQKRETGRSGRRVQRTSNFPEAPEWMNLLLNICGVYAIINFALFFMLMVAFTPDLHERNGQYVIEKNRTFIRKATTEEIRRYRSRESRGFSGHWMLFYWASLTGLVDARRRASIQQADQGRAFVPAGRYMGTPPMLSLWSHSTMMFLATFVCFFGFPLAESFVFISLQQKYYPRIKVFGLIAFLLFIPCGLLGLWIVPRILRFIPARCPLCDGRAYYEGGILGSSSVPRPYRCIDCGEITDQAEN